MGVREETVADVALNASVTQARDETNTVKSVTKSLELLNCFTDDHPEWGVSELAKYLGFGKSAVHRFLTSFEAAGFLERTATHRYRLGIRCVELGMMFQINDRLIRASECGLRKLAEDTGSIAHLSRLDGRETVELLRFCTMKRQIQTPRISTRREAHATAKGKIFLAYSGEDYLLKFLGPRQFLKTYTGLTIDTPVRLRAELRQIRQQGFALDDQESYMGMRCLAVPVYSSPNRLAAALSISNSIRDIPTAALPHLIAKLRRVANEIGSNLRRSS
jgi:DNA-binding IclR family transcriptional regulator